MGEGGRDILLQTHKKAWGEYVFSSSFILLKLKNSRMILKACGVLACLPNVECMRELDSMLIFKKISLPNRTDV